MTIADGTREVVIKTLELLETNKQESSPQEVLQLAQVYALLYIGDRMGYLNKTIDMLIPAIRGLR